MNRLGVLVGNTGEQAQRERRLRGAVYQDGVPIKVSHPSPHLSVAWSGNDQLAAVARQHDRFVLAYGSAYGISGSRKADVSVDDITGFAEHLLQRSGSSEFYLNDVEGSFIAVAGNQDDQILVSGDPTGNRAPYISVRGEELALSNQPLVCAKLSGSPQLDRGLEDFLLVYGFLPDGRTVYKNVRALQQGKLLRRQDGAWVENAFPGNGPPGPAADAPETEDVLFDRLYELMMRCTEDQLTSRPEVGVLLGGFDSALVAAVLQRLGKSVTTYSFRYADTEFNQPHTDTLSRYLGVKHRWIDITPEVIAAGLDRFAENYVQPTNWLNYVIQTVYVCEQMRDDGIEYAYSGDGCDSVFLGYPGTYKRTRAFARLPELPTSVVNALTGMFSWSQIDRSLGHPYRVAMNLMRSMALPMPARAFLTFRVMDEGTVRALRGTQAPTQDESVESIVRRLAEPYHGLPIQRLGYAAKGLVSPNRAKLVASLDVAGVRVHSPYMHTSLRRFAASVPVDMLREKSQSGVKDPGKICLSRMAEKHRMLPPEIIHQPKLAAIDSPVDGWFAGALRPSVEHALAGLPFVPDAKHVESLIKTTWAEDFYKRNIGSTRVISDAISLLTTYAAMASEVQRPGQAQ